jgi:hypothetical protein
MSHSPISSDPGHPRGEVVSSKLVQAAKETLADRFCRSLARDHTPKKPIPDEKKGHKICLSYKQNLETRLDRNV